MKIKVGRVKNIPGKVISVELSVEPDGFFTGEEKINLLEPVVFSGTVENMGPTLVVQGQVTTLVELECHRCTEKVSYPVKTIFSEVYSNQKDVIERDPEGEIDFFAGDEIDIAPQVMQNILLELPMKVLCREDCRGLCAGCGTNLNFKQCRCVEENIDPRLMALKKLLK